MYVFVVSLLAPLSLLQEAGSHGVKDSLDKMLKEWKPKNFKLTAVNGMIPEKVRCLSCYVAS